MAQERDREVTEPEEIVADDWDSLAPPVDDVEVEAESDEGPPVAHGGLFGIDLGGRGTRIDEPMPEDTPPPTPLKRLTRTLTERLASAAAARRGRATDEDEDEPPSKE